MQTTQDMTKAAPPAAGTSYKTKSWSTRSKCCVRWGGQVKSKGFCFGMGMGNSLVWELLSEENLVLMQSGGSPAVPVVGEPFVHGLKPFCPWCTHTLITSWAQLATETGFGHIFDFPTKPAAPALPPRATEVWSLCFENCAPSGKIWWWAESTLTDPSQEEAARAEDVAVMCKLLHKLHNFPFYWCQSINKRPALCSVPQQNTTEERLICSGPPLYFAVSSPSNIGCSVSYKGIFSRFFLLAFIAGF